MVSPIARVVSHLLGALERAGIAREVWAVWDIEDAGVRFSPGRDQYVRGKWIAVDAAPTPQIALQVARIYTVATQRATFVRRELRVLGVTVRTTLRDAAGFLADQDDGGTPTGARQVSMEPAPPDAPAAFDDAGAWDGFGE